MLNEPSKSLLKAIAEKTSQLRREIEVKSVELALLEGVEYNKYPDAYLTHVCMENDPLVLFAGDKVMTKYGDIVTIKSFDVEGSGINFEDHETLGDHRISHVIKRNRHGLEFDHTQSWHEES